MATRVWLAGEQDLESVAALMGGFRDHMGKEQPSDADIRATVATLLRDPQTEFLLAAPDGERAAGVCQLRYRLAVWTGADDCWLEDLFVEESDRRFGLGQALVAGTIDRARERGCGRIELDVAESNRAAWALYERMGFSAGYKPPAPNVLMGLRL